MNENVKLHLTAITSRLYDLHLALLNIPAAARDGEDMGGSAGTRLSREQWMTKPGSKKSDCKPSFSSQKGAWGGCGFHMDSESVWWRIELGYAWEALGPYVKSAGRLRLMGVKKIWLILRSHEMREIVQTDTD